MLLKSHKELATAQNAKGRTPLVAACLAPGANAKVAQALLDATPELLMAVDVEGKTLLHLVGATGKNEDVVWLLGERGGAKLIRTKDSAGADCIANAAPNVVTILEELLEREDDGGGEGPVPSRVV